MTVHHINQLGDNQFFRIKQSDMDNWLYCKVLGKTIENIFYKIYKTEYDFDFTLRELGVDYILEVLDIDEVQLLLSIDA